MTKLGSTHVSDDPDSRGTPGDTGADGATGATGADGADGAVGNVPLTTKGDIMSYDTDDQRLAVGADTEVLTADSTTPTGLKWAAAAGGSSGVPLSVSTLGTGQPEAFSSSANAVKGVILEMTGTVVLESLQIMTDNAASSTYKVMVCEVSGATNVIDVILFESPVSGISVIDTRHLFVPSSPITLTSGKTIAILMVRTDGTATTACRVTLGSPAVDLDGYWTMEGYVLSNSTNNPIVTTVLGALAGTGIGLMARIGLRI